jgi:3-oxoacyl-[acyl-carrier protein] reductase
MCKEGKLAGKVALVTGGSRGIGKAICQKLAAEGASLVIVSTKVVDELVEEFKAAGTDAISLAVNVADADEVAAAVKQALDHFGKIDILVNNAGITRDNLLMRMKEADWDLVMDVNLKGVFNFTKAVMRSMMKARTGRIVNVTSVVGVMGNAGQANYAASKAGVIGFTKSCAKELGARGITVNAIAPGFIQTDMTHDLPEAAKEAFLNSVPLKRAGEASDVANVVGFLSSEESSYITGQVINIDGGLLM